MVKLNVVAHRALGESVVSTLAQAKTSVAALVRALYGDGLRYEMIAGDAPVKECKVMLAAFMLSCRPANEQTILSKPRTEYVLLQDQALWDAAHKNHGAVMTAMRAGFKAHQGLDGRRERGANKAKDAAPVAVFAAPESVEQALLAFTATAAKVNTWGFSAKAAADIGDALNAVIALMRANKPADKTPAKAPAKTKAPAKVKA